MENPRRVLLQQMAVATSLPDFYLACKALDNLEYLLMQAQTAGPASMQPSTYGQNNYQRPSGPGPFSFAPQQAPQARPEQHEVRPSSEPSWDEGTPWAGEL